MGHRRVISCFLFITVIQGHTCQDRRDSNTLFSKHLEDANNTSGESQDLGWSEWLEWSACSRTCDGGTAVQLRTCHGPLPCPGTLLRYRLCNIQPCPEPIDYRDYQCAQFNEPPRDGRTTKWTAYRGHDDNPCRLKCQSDDGQVAVLASSVKDGTRCGAGSLDLCVDGICQSVGCDLVIGSKAKVDACGVCAGDGSSCLHPLYTWNILSASFCSTTCGSGYKMSQVVCKNVVTGVEVDSSLCDESLKPPVEVIKCNTHPCPPKWVGDVWSECSRRCGGGTRSRSISCIQHINSSLVQVKEEDCKGVRPEKWEACNTEPCPASWNPTHWSKCSVSCGHGIQTRNLTCHLPHGSDNSTCDFLDKPDTTKPCSTGIPCNSFYPDEIPEIDESIKILHPYPAFHPVAEKLIGEEKTSSSLFSDASPDDGKIHFRNVG